MKSSENIKPNGIPVQSVSGTSLIQKHKYNPIIDKGKNHEAIREIIKPNDNPVQSWYPDLP